MGAHLEVGMVLAAFVTAASAGSILINEVLYDPDTKGGDDGHEWVELCNAGDETIDLSGWVLESAGAGWSTSFVITELVVSAGARVVIGADGDLAGSFSPNLQNGGSETDGVRLVDAEGVVVDTVLYDSPNTNELADDHGAIGASFALDPAAGSSLARVPDCVDTDNAGADFVEATTPTPGADNDVAEALCPGALTINELVANPMGADEGQEWIELYNAGTASVPLLGWALGWGTSAVSTTAVFDSTLEVPAGGFVVIGGPKAGADIVVDMNLGNASTSADIVVLEDCTGAVVDTVIYGPKNTDGFVDDEGWVAVSLAPTPADGESLARMPDGYDTHQAGDDFVIADPPTPGTSNTEGPADCPGANDIKINEFLPNPESTDQGAEWVELYNAGQQTVRLDGWVLQWGNSAYSDSAALPVGVEVDPGAFLVVGDELVPEADVVAELALGNATSSGDALRLQHCGGGTADTVIYGPDNSDGFLDDAGQEATSLAPAPGSAQSVARIADGLDSDDGGADFALLDVPTPGAPNPTVIPAECHEAASAIKVNELLPDPEGSDDGLEWIELYNAGQTTQRLDDWVIDIGKSDWGDAITLPGGLELEPGGYLVVGGADVAEVGVVTTELSLGNAGTAPDGVRLVDCEGMVQDTMLYGDGDIEDPLFDDQGEVTMVAFPRSGLSVGRATDGVDTDDNEEDFLTDLSPTPGAANSASSNVGTAISKGCRKQGPAGTKTCTTGGAGFWWMALALVAARRRNPAY